MLDVGTVIAVVFIKREEMREKDIKGSVFVSGRLAEWHIAHTLGEVFTVLRSSKIMFSIFSLKR